MENHFKKSLQKQKIKKRPTPVFSGPRRPREVCDPLFPTDVEAQAEQVSKRKSS